MSIVRHLPPHLPRHLVQPDRVGLPYIEGSGSAIGLVLTALTETRSTEGWYYTSATTGAWAGTNTLRLDDRGDGGGPLVYLEGSRTQLIADPRAAAGSGWAAGLSNVFTADAATGVDGTSLADQQNTTSAGYGQYYTLGAISGFYTASMFVRNVSGSANVHFAMQNGAGGTGIYVDAACSTSWSRVQGTYDCSGGVTSYWVPSEARTTGGLTAQNQNTYQDLHQVEAGKFASSPIRTASGTRGADTLTGTPAQCPPWLRTRGRIPIVSPSFANTDMANGDIQWLLSFDSGSDGIRWNRDATDLRLEVVAGGVVKARTAAITCSKDQLLTNLAWDSAAGTLTLGGAAGVTSTWSWAAPATGFRIGGIYGAATNYFGRVSKVWLPG